MLTERIVGFRALHFLDEFCLPHSYRHFLRTASINFIKCSMEILRDFVRYSAWLHSHLISSSSPLSFTLFQMVIRINSYFVGEFTSFQSFIADFKFLSPFSYCLITILRFDVYADGFANACLMRRFMLEATRASSPVHARQFSLKNANYDHSIGNIGAEARMIQIRASSIDD
jgi:hypothetical protein